MPSCRLGVHVQWGSCPIIRRSGKIGHSCADKEPTCPKKKPYCPKKKPLPSRKNHARQLQTTQCAAGGAGVIGVRNRRINLHTERTLDSGYVWNLKEGKDRKVINHTFCREKKNQTNEKPNSSGLETTCPIDLFAQLTCFAPLTT